jgi:two-component system KDP operon response regulator KdpE
MSSKPVVLIIEDDQPIANFIEMAVVTQGYKPLLARNGTTGISLVTSWNPDIILLDLGLPDMDGIDVIRRIRMFCESPIIIVSARHQDHEKVMALDAGADDYLAKPFSVPELLARIRVALRHLEKISLEQDAVEESTYQNRELVIDYVHRLVTIRDEVIHLTPIEYEILCLLATHTDRVLTHKLILQKTRGQFQPESDSQTLRVFISNIRRKIEKNPADPEYIFTEVGVGYRLASTT